MTDTLIRGEGGKFEQKGDEKRKMRAITLTDTAWENLAAVAKSRGCSRADLIEIATQEGGRWDWDAREEMIAEIADLGQELIEDADLTRNGKDKGVVRRTLTALIEALQ